MITYQIGDNIAVRVNESSDIIFDVDFDDPRYKGYKTSHYELIGKDSTQYVIRCSGYVDGSCIISNTMSILYGIDARFVGGSGYLLKMTSIGSRKTPDYYTHPIRCCLCDASVPYGIPNQKDGIRFVCWSCRDDTRNHFKIEALRITDKDDA
jgi:hypothetical protein